MARRLGLSTGVALAVAWTAPAPAAGDSGTAALQAALRARSLYAGAVDGIAGPATRAGVRRLQAAHGLVVDGIAGPVTRRALGWRGRPALGSRLLTQGRRGWDVAALQFLLEVHGFPSGPVDGILGPRADAALRRFQAWAGLPADGVAGPATLRALSRPPPRSSLRFARPLVAPIGDRFGPRGAGFHAGIDFPARSGARVGAARAGCVISAGWDPGGYGKLVVLSHGYGMTSWYAHLSAISVRRGECVALGARVGRVGATGFSTGPHLHFELRLRGAAVDPLGAL